MKFSLISLFAGLCVVTFLGACSNSGHSGSPAANPQTRANGTGDSGGGNSYMGRPLESYIQDPTKLASYQSLIGPITAKLITPDGNGASPDMGRLFKYVLKAKTWYFIPGELTVLPKERIGSAVSTEQVALQNLHEVWVNTQIFNAMNADDQSKLVLHEILMGIRLLQFDSLTNQCLAFAPSDRGLCDNMPDQLNGSPKDLKEQDYVDIRATVIEILERYQEFNRYEDWDDLLGRHHFSLEEHTFRTKSDSGFMDRKDFLRSLKMAMITKALPHFGYRFDGDRTKPPEPCQVSFENFETGAPLVIHLQTPIGDFKVTQNLADSNNPFPYNKWDEFGRKLSEVSPVPFAERQTHVGDKTLSANFFFELQDLAGIEVRETVCTDEETDPVTGAISCTGARTPSEARAYLCLTQPAQWK
jgi:hypothetical protein